MRRADLVLAVLVAFQFAARADDFIDGTNAPKILHYDVLLTPDFDSNVMRTRVCCKIRNDAPTAVKQLDFDVLGRETFYDVKVSVTGVSLRAKGKDIPQEVSHSIRGKPGSPSQLGTLKAPKVTHVVLSSALAPGSVAPLTFDYKWQVLKPTGTDVHYRLFATLPNGEKEVCLLSDFPWLPELLAVRPDELRQMYDKNWYPRTEKPTWEIRIATPAGYEGVALDGRSAGAERRRNQIVSRWESRAPGEPQVMIGRFDRVAVKRPQATVVFYLPKQGYERKAVELMGDFLARVYGRYSKWYGPLNGKEIHIGVSSANQGGHGAYMGMTLGLWRFRDAKELTGPSAYSVFETPAHELAHSWWGISVTSYGRGTKFLRESLAQFSCWHLSKELFGADRFGEYLAHEFWQGTHAHPLLLPDSDSQVRAYRKGPLVLNVLKSEMGEELFFRVLKGFATRYKDTYATFSDFVAVCNDISGKDFKPFFDQWCWREGCPDYRLVKFESKEKQGGWHTSVTIRNAGKGTITCPLELRMATGRQRETFRVAEGATKTFAYKTPAKVEAAVIDPDHNTYQGSGQERRLKMLGVGQTQWTWIWYWRGVVLAEMGEYDKAIAELTRTIRLHVHPGFSYSRGIAHLLKGDAEAATADLSRFITAMVYKPSLIDTLAYAGVVAGSPQQRRAELHLILKRLTGHDIRYDTKKGASKEEWQRVFSRWRGWWHLNKADFRLAPSARSLRPRGLRSANMSGPVDQRTRSWVGGRLRSVDPGGEDGQGGEGGGLDA